MVAVAAAGIPSPKDLEPVIREACTEKQRQALALRAAGYSLSQIADVLDVTKSTARVHLAAGIRNVQRVLERQAA